MFGCVLPVRLSHTPKAYFLFQISFSFPASFFLSGFVQIDVCRGRLVLLEVCPSGGLFPSLSFPSSARTASENLRLRSLFATQKKKKKSNSISRHLSFKSLISYLEGCRGVCVHYEAYARPFLSSLIPPLDSLRCSTELVGSALYSVGTRFENLLS